MSIVKTPMAVSSLSLRGSGNYLSELSARNMSYNFLYRKNICYVHQVVSRKKSAPGVFTIDINDKYCLNLPSLLGGKDNQPSLQALNHLALKIKDNFSPSALEKYSKIPNQNILWKIELFIELYKFL